MTFGQPFAFFMSPATVRRCWKVFIYFCSSISPFAYPVSIHHWCCFCDICGVQWWIFTFVSSASKCDKGESIRFWGQKVKGQGQWAEAYRARHVKNLAAVPALESWRPPGCPPPTRGWVWGGGRAPSPDNFWIFLHKNGVFWCTLEHGF